MRCCLLGLFAGCLLVVSIGCGSGDGRLKVYPVSGTVTVKGQPAEGAMVVLYPADEALRAEPGRPLPTGTAGSDGIFRLSSYAPNDGAPAGEYQVTIMWPDTPIEGPGNPDTPPVRDLLNSRYAAPASSGLTATIEARATELPPFELP